jgi:hypothetical protein
LFAVKPNSGKSAALFYPLRRTMTSPMPDWFIERSTAELRKILGVGGEKYKVAKDSRRMLREFIEMGACRSQKAGFPVASGVWGRIGMCFLRSFPGFVPLMPLNISFFRSSFKDRSMAAGLIVSSFALMSGIDK